MTYDCAWKLDQGRDVPTRLHDQVVRTEMAYETVDRAMQAFAPWACQGTALSLMQAAQNHGASTTARPRSTNGGGRTFGDNGK